MEGVEGELTEAIQNELLAGDGSVPSEDEINQMLLSNTQPNKQEGGYFSPQPWFSIHPKSPVCYVRCAMPAFRQIWSICIQIY